MVPEELNEIRVAIDRLDDEIVELLNRRMALVKKVGEIKTKEGLHTFDPGREEAICRRLTRTNKGPISDDSLRAIYVEVLAASRKLQHRLHVAYLGPEWTYSHVAALSLFGHGTGYVACSTLADAFDALSKGKVQVAVVPIENSVEGGVGQTIDLLYLSQVRVIRECYLEIAHCLCSCAQDLHRIRKLYAQPHALGQCRHWILENLALAEIHECASTAQAAKAAASDPEGAAICNLRAAQYYGIRVLDEHIEDRPGNVTRFLALGHEENEPTGEDKTSLLFAVGDRPGALYYALEPFSRFGLNMTWIESRPNRLDPWQYLFSADIEGHRDDRRVKDALNVVSQRVTFLKVLGSYPRSNPKEPIRLEMERVRHGK